MRDPKDELESLIKENGGVLVRNKRHNVYKFPNGLVFTVSQTPECPYGFRHAVDDLKRFLGLNNPNRGKPGERREKKKRQVSKPKPVEVISGATRPTWQEQVAALNETEEVYFLQAMRISGVKPIGG